MLVNTQTFWSYIINESDIVTSNIYNYLTRNDYDFDTKTIKTSNYAQIVNRINNTNTLRFPTGLIPYITKKFALQVYTVDRHYPIYTKNDVLNIAKELQQTIPNFEIRDYQIDAVLASLDKFNSLIHSGVGTGKGQPGNTLIQTTRGFKFLNKIKVGDKVFNKDAKAVKVIGIYPQGKQKVYKVSFKSGKYTYCDESHLWTFYLDNKLITISTKELLTINKEKYSNYKCLSQTILEFNKNLSKKHLDEILNKIKNNQLNVIPLCIYKTNSKNRKYFLNELLKLNLSDTFNIQSIKRLAFSLNKIYEKNNLIDIKDDSLSDIVYVKEDYTYCIKLDSNDGLYITSNYVITHNTTIMSFVCKILKDDKILILNNKNFILQQIYDRLTSFGIDDISWNPSKKPDYSKRIVIMNTKGSDQALNRNDQEYINYLKTVNTWITDECFEGNAEILTNQGWKKFKELTGNELFANFKAETKEIYFTSGKLIKRFHNENCINWKVHDKSNIILTPHHQQLYYEYDLPKKKNICDISFYNDGKYIACSGKGIGKDLHLTPLEKILIALQKNNSSAQKIDKRCYCITFYKQKEIDKWLSLLKKFNGKVIELKPLTKNNKIIRRWYIWLPKHIETNIKYLNKYFDLTTFSQTKAIEFLNEIKEWNTINYIKNTITYVSKEKTNADFISAIATLAGYCSYQKYNKKQYNVFMKSTYKKNLQKCKKEEISYNDYVYCVEVPEHNIVVRSSGNNQYTFISGNCQHIQAITSFEPVFYMDVENLKHIIGYSGSPFRNQEHPYADKDDFTTIAILGERAFVCEMKDAIKEEIIAQPYCYFINYPNKAMYVPENLKNNYFMQYRANITYNKARNAAGKALLEFMNQVKIKTLVSFNNKKPAQKIMKELKEIGIDSLFICGNEIIYEWVYDKNNKLVLSTRNGNTQDIKDALNNGYNIIFGSQVMDEGVDIRDFQAVVLFSAGKSPISGIQRIGRASRKKLNGKNISFVIDFKDTGGYPMFQSQYEKRRAFMIASGVKILDNAKDFCKLVLDVSKLQDNE